MERNIPSQRVPLSGISGECPYRFRFACEDPKLEASLEKRGILFPLLAVWRRHARATVVSGHKRFFYAQRKELKEIPVSFIEEKFSEKELFLLALYANWNQNFSDLDRMEALRKGEKDFGLTPAEIRDEVSPPLGIPPGEGLLEEYRRVGGLVPEIHALIHQNKIPFRGASSLARFTRAEQLFLAQNVFEPMHLTTNHLLRVGEWLSDLKRAKKASLDALLQEAPVQEILRNPRLDPRAKGEKFFYALRSLRFPRLSEKEKGFSRLQRELGEAEEICLERPESFEGEGILLRARLKNRGSVSRVLRYLETHHRSLESFLA